MPRAFINALCAFFLFLLLLQMNNLKQNAQNTYKKRVMPTSPSPKTFPPRLFRNNTDDMLNEREKNKMLSEEMEATLHDIQNM